MIKKIDHVVITTTNPSVCLEFYKKIGFRINTTNGRYELFAGDFKINVHVLGSELSPHASSVTPGSADLCFEIDSPLPLFVSNLLSLGIEFETEIVERTGAQGLINSIYLRDPDKNLIEFCSYN